MKLYHGSKVQNLKVLKPSSHNVVGKQKVVFASPDEKFAVAMIYGTGNELAVGYHINTKTNHKEFYIDELKPGKLTLLTQPGSLYLIQDQSFQSHPDLMPEELISSTPAKIIKEIKLPNPLQHLKKLKAKIIQYNDVPKSMQQRGKDPKQPKTKYQKDRFE